MDKKITVICCTNKVGGADTLRASLDNQIFPHKDVEVILVDHFYAERKDIVRPYFSDADYDVIHLQGDREPAINLAHNFNKALIEATGELVVSFEDYQLAAPDWLQKHWDVYVNSQRKASFQGRMHNAAFPATKWGTKRLMEEGNVLVPIDEVTISVFPTTPEISTLTNVEMDTKLEQQRFQPGTLLRPFSTQVYRNVSAPLETFLEVRGYDEDFDGPTLKNCPSADLYFRMELVGHRFFFDNGGDVYHLDHYDAFNWDRRADYQYLFSKVFTQITRGIMVAKENHLGERRAVRHNTLYHKHDVINALAERFDFKDYLEVGTYCGDCWRHVYGMNKFGMDPDPKFGDDGIVKMTSDEFFAKNTQMYDIILVDGLHERAQALRDVRNALKVLKPGGVILMDDVNPKTEEMQRYPRPREDMEWTGDVWKAFLELRSDPLLECFTLNVDYGLGVVRRRADNRASSHLAAVALEPFLEGPDAWELFDARRVALLELHGPGALWGLVGLPRA